MHDYQALTKSYVKLPKGGKIPNSNQIDTVQYLIQSTVIAETYQSEYLLQYKPYKSNSELSKNPNPGKKIWQRGQGGGISTQEQKAAIFYTHDTLSRSLLQNRIVT